MKLSTPMKLTAIVVLTSVTLAFVVASQGIYGPVVPEFSLGTTRNSATVTMKGTIQELISDCAAQANSTVTCFRFDLMVLRSNDGYTYLLKDLPAPAEEWRGVNATVTGTLVTPSQSGIAFIRGDLYVSQITSQLILSSSSRLPY